MTLGCEGRNRPCPTWHDKHFGVLTGQWDVTVGLGKNETRRLLAYVGGAAKGRKSFTAVSNATGQHKRRELLLLTRDNRVYVDHELTVLPILCQSVSQFSSPLWIQFTPPATTPDPKKGISREDCYAAQSKIDFPSSSTDFRLLP